MSKKWFVVQVLFTGLLLYLVFAPAPFGMEKKPHFKAPCKIRWHDDFDCQAMEDGSWLAVGTHNKSLIYYGKWHVEGTTLIIEERMVSNQFGPKSKPFILKVELTKDLKQCKGTHVRIIRD